VPVLADDTPQTLAARVFRAECDVYPAAIAMRWREIRDA
jgi:folate-dependent phosphoribosylglycinamide formyltransferase PurN